MPAVLRSALLRALTVCVALVSACTETGTFEDQLFTRGAGGAGGGLDPDSGPSTGGTGGGDSGVVDGGPKEAELCIPAVASEQLRARSNVMARPNAVASSSNSGFYTRDLFNLFASHCGGCHVDSNQGGLKVTLMNFSSTVTEKAVRRIRSEAMYMPPDGAGGMPFSKRQEGDPVAELASLLEAWIEAGRPSDVFYPEKSAAGGEVSYLLSPEVGMGMTNLANCVPPKQMVGMEKEKSVELDAMFEKATVLPERLEQTDLFSLDAEVLAKHGVVAFAPAYTLWADNAKKIRFVRTPHGKPIEFDRERQHFSIPPNSRFYKTFFRKVVDRKGNESYRKMETRLILARPDAPDGTPTALFGTYAWNEEETEAVLVRDPLRNGKPFRDRLTTFVTDERAADAVIATGPRDLQQALRKEGLLRTYAIPGSERCIQCHMGAPDASFILGFTPLQIHRQPMGEHGVLEEAKRDELNQLQRLIDYRVIKGMTSPDEVLLLEDTQGDRKPRNEHELKAQGYMVGNCAHCHNPRGFPSITEPSLKPLLDFWPSPKGGIFQFPLDRFSPRIRRGERQDMQMPYITPALFDFTPYYNARAPTNIIDWQLKFVDLQLDGVGPEMDPQLAYMVPLMAPWRSLIYRNVDTPFSYEDDFAIFPRMPMNTPGYDCRVRQLLGTWMTSIPARPSYDALVLPEVGSVAWENQTRAAEPQLYTEVTPADEDYERRVSEAETRVRAFERSQRYIDCPDPALDIVDPNVIELGRLVPAPLEREYDAGSGAKGFYKIKVPERPHWAVTDLTDPPGNWFPRRNDWQDVIVSPDQAMLPEHLKLLFGLLQDIRITDEFRDFALEAKPFGLWEEKPTCKLDSLPKANDFSESARPRWFKYAGGALEDGAIYSISPGAQVFRSICSNCHGPEADSRGRLAATIADMTGGQTRVANLRDGIFGPVSDPGSNRARVFGEVGTDPDEWAARYLLWMTMGGTQRVIPQAALTVIGNSNVLGVKRAVPPPRITDANMLSVAKFLCEQALPRSTMGFDHTDGSLGQEHTDGSRSALIGKNGDAELWTALCGFDNPIPVRGISVRQDESKRFLSFDYLAVPGSTDTIFPLYRREAYPNGALVGDQRGRIEPVEGGIPAENLEPWCVIRPTDQISLDYLASLWDDPPYCPDALLADANRWTTAEIERWILRGAMNAGMSVFVYLDALSKGKAPRAIGFDQCEQLPQGD